MAKIRSPDKKVVFFILFRLGGIKIKINFKGKQRSGLADFCSILYTVELTANILKEIRYVIKIIMNLFSERLAYEKSALRYILVQN